ncbi:4956_t:CDS:2 [Gigaspora margarita]|uniref:4956_t:CDS:1 n=1 Tax=Gigaspora margarita TaxID=4874 RepID=A0ABN7VLK7_GIGMA|nr:4956_t:CDS:2 [Gigaspora margarita]
MSELKVSLFDNFECAAEANNWNGNCRLQIALGYLKEAMADWYRESSSHPREATLLANRTQFLDSTRSRKSGYVYYKIQKLFNCVNTNNCLPDEYIVRMFLSSLKGMSTALVVITIPKKLSKTVAMARRVKASNYYGQHNSKLVRQSKLKNKLGDIKKKINEMVLNYTALAYKLDKASSGC